MYISLIQPFLTDCIYEVGNGYIFMINNSIVIAKLVIVFAIVTTIYVIVAINIAIIAKLEVYLTETIHMSIKNRQNPHRNA